MNVPTLLDKFIVGLARLVHKTEAVADKIAADVHAIAERIEDKVETAIEFLISIPDGVIAAALDAASAGHFDNWRASIVDLIKAIGFDDTASMRFRKGLAVQLGIVDQEEDYKGSPVQNNALRRALLAELSHRRIGLPLAA